MNGTTHNQSLLPTPLTPLAFAPGVKGALAALGAAEFNRYRAEQSSASLAGCKSPLGKG